MLGMQWRIQGGGGLPPLFLDQTEAQRAEKNFFAYRTPPPYLRFWISELIFWRRMALLSKIASELNFKWNRTYNNHWHSNQTTLLSFP